MAALQTAARLLEECHLPTCTLHMQTAWHVPKGWDRWFAFGEIDCEWRVGGALGVAASWCVWPVECNVRCARTTAFQVQSPRSARLSAYPAFARPPRALADYNYTISDQGANKWFFTEPEDYSTGVEWGAGRK